MSSADTPALNRSREYPATTQSGYVMLMLSLVLAALAVWLFLGAVAGDGPPHGLWLVGAAVSGFFSLFCLTGFYMINPNEAVRRLQGHRPQRGLALGVAVAGPQ
jgi:drug/metabolite transporter (DMT)-like permease